MWRDREPDSRSSILHFRQLGPEGSRFAPGGRGREIDARVAAGDGELVIDKGEPDMFVGTKLAELLAARGVDEVIVCGFASEACVDTTVRSAWGKGFRVVLASGAHTTTANPVLGAAEIIKHHEFVLQRFARVVPAAEVVFG